MQGHSDVNNTKQNWGTCENKQHVVLAFVLFPLVAGSDIYSIVAILSCRNYFINWIRNNSIANIRIDPAFIIIIIITNGLWLCAVLFQTILFISGEFLFRRLLVFIIINLVFFFLLILIESTIINVMIPYVFPIGV